jgi:hypothetical protein
LIDQMVRIAAHSVGTELPVFVCDLQAIAEHLQLAREAVDELRQIYPESTPSNVHATYMSPWKSHTLNAKLSPLCDSAVTIAERCSQMINAVPLHQLNMALTVTDCWGAIYEKSDHATRHNHFPADFSVVVYLQADDDCAPLIFAGGRSFQPLAGSMICFPGILDHEVPASASRRVVVAMNLNKKATFSVANP